MCVAYKKGDTVNWWMVVVNTQQTGSLTCSTDCLVPGARWAGHASITLDTRVCHVGVWAVKPSRAQETVVDVTTGNDVPTTQQVNTRDEPKGNEDIM